MTIHTWNLSQTCQIPASVDLKRSDDGALVATLHHTERGEIPIQHIKGMPENLQGLASTTARVKQVGDGWRLRIAPLITEESQVSMECADSTDLVMKYTRKAIDRASKVRGQDIVAVIGNTGDGKSTLIDHLLGGSMVQGMARLYSLNSRRWIEKSNCVMPKDPLDEHAKIGHASTRSETHFTKVYSNDRLNLADCAGFLETREGHYKITGPLSVMYTLKSARSIKLLVCVSYANLTATRCQHFGELVNRIVQNFSRKGREHELFSQVILVITKAPKDYTSKDAVKGIQEIIDDTPDDHPYKTYYEGIIRDNGSYIKVYDPLDGGESCASIRELLIPPQSPSPTPIPSPDIIDPKPCMDFFSQRLATIVGRMRSVSGQIQDVKQRLKALKEEKTSLEEKKIEAESSSRELSDHKEKLTREIEDAKSTIARKNQEIDSIKGSQEIDLSAFSIDNIRQRLENGARFSISELKKIKSELEKLKETTDPNPIFDQEIKEDNHGFITVKNIRRIRAFMAFMGDFASFAISVGLVAGSVGFGVASIFFPLAIIGWAVFTGAGVVKCTMDTISESKTQETRIKTTTYQFSYDGIPFSKIELLPNRKNGCWASKSSIIDRDQGTGRFSIDYVMPIGEQAHAHVRLYAKIGDTPEYKRMIESLEEEEKSRWQQIERLNDENRDLNAAIARNKQHIKEDSTEKLCDDLADRISTKEKLIIQTEEEKRQTTNELASMRDEVVFFSNMIELSAISDEWIPAEFLTLRRQLFPDIVGT